MQLFTGPSDFDSQRPIMSSKGGGSAMHLSSTGSYKKVSNKLPKINQSKDYFKFMTTLDQAKEKKK